MDKNKHRKQSILDMQFEMAMNGSIEMLKWLGIQYAGQSNQPNDADTPPASGFEISMFNTPEQDEYEKYRDEFLEWKKGKVN